VIYTAAECRVRANLKLDQAESDDRHAERHIAAAQTWLMLARALIKMEAWGLQWHVDPPKPPRTKKPKSKKNGHDVTAVPAAAVRSRSVRARTLSEFRAARSIDESAP
jgi:hypothetical protein